MFAFNGELDKQLVWVLANEDVGRRRLAVRVLATIVINRRHNALYALTFYYLDRN